MSITAYATQSDVTFVLGQYGLEVRADDDADGGLETGFITSGLEVATVGMNHRLFSRYTVAVIAASSWAKWCCAYLAAEVFCRRRGLAIPESLKLECDEYKKTLEAIRSGNEYMMADTGLACPKSDTSPAMTNLTVDGRFHRSKIRRVPATSTGADPGPNVLRKDAIDYASEWS